MSSIIQLKVANSKVSVKQIKTSADAYSKVLVVTYVPANSVYVKATG